MGAVNKGLTKYWFIIYVLAALLVLGGLLNLGVHLGPKLEDWLMAKFIPEVWQSTVDDLIHRLFRDELRSFLVTSGFGLGIVIIGLTLFPLKEKLSATYEKERFPELEKQAQAPLWRQGLEEVKLAGLYLILQGMSFYLAMQGQTTLATLGSSLSVAYLVGAMAFDHCAPFFQRRDRKLHGILWIFLRHAPLRTFLIGLICIGPVLLLEKTLPSSLSPTIAISILVFTEVLGMACATLLGCHLGAALLKEDPKLILNPPPRSWTISYRAVVLTLSIWLVIFFGWWAKGAITHASFLKCRFRPLWQEAEIRLRDTSMIVSLPVQVRNRSEGSIDPTELTIEIQGKGIIEGEVMLQGPIIQGSETKNLELTFAADLSEAAILDLPKFLKAEYSAHLKLEPPLSKPFLLEIFPQ